MKNKSGFTLIELVMALVIGGIIIYPLLAIFITAPQKNPSMEAFNIALHLANCKLETASNKKFNSISSEGTASFGGNFNDYNSEVVVHYVASSEIEVSVDPAVTDYKWIKVRVTGANIPGGSVELTTLAADDK